MQTKVVFFKPKVSIQGANSPDTNGFAQLNLPIGVKNEGIKLMLRGNIISLQFVVNLIQFVHPIKSNQIQCN